MRDEVRLRHILDACDAIVQDLANERRDRTTRQAIERNLEIIGVASKALSDDLKTQHPNVPWRNITGFRNILAHEYFIVDEPTIWEIAEHKIPALRNWVEGIIEQFKMAEK